MPNPSAVAAPPGSWAEVRARDHVIRYRRSGAGPPVLVLCPPDAPALWPGLPDALATRARLITPELPSSCSDAAARLSDFLEGLGASTVGVVAAECYCITALELMLRGTGQVARVVLVPGGAGAEPALDGVLATAGCERAVPLLVVRRGLASAEALPLVTRFLVGDGAGSAQA